MFSFTVITWFTFCIIINVEGRDDTFLIKQPQQAKDTTTNNAVKLIYQCNMGQQKLVLSEAKGLFVLSSTYCKYKSYRSRYVIYALMAAGQRYIKT